jgi:hypothetical protein
MADDWPKPIQGSTKSVLQGGVALPHPTGLIHWGIDAVRQQVEGSKGVPDPVLVCSNVVLLEVRER